MSHSRYSGSPRNDTEDRPWEAAGAYSDGSSKALCVGKSDFNMSHHLNGSGSMMDERLAD
jgi:hypothetical protein